MSFMGIGLKTGMTKQKEICAEHGVRLWRLSVTVVAIVINQR
jgi:hypothetical protein